MNKIEKRILHGLYFHREMVGEMFAYTADDIRWLTVHSRRAGKARVKDGRLQTTDPGDPRIKRFKLVTADDERPLRYLEQGGYIARERMRGGTGLHLSVTVSGAEYARQLGTPWGSINLWYREHKDGLLGILFTVLVAALTATIASHPTAQRAQDATKCLPQPSSSTSPPTPKAR